ncbi:MAG: response regulator [Lachnospiraceae bacterium]
MSCFKKIVFFTLGFDLLLLLFVALGFKVDDMTLSKGKVDEFNSGWVLTGEDGESVILDKLPYMGESTAEETLVMENTIPPEYFGKTLAFLSADKALRVRMDQEVVYEFGMEDERAFGHTPGSVVNFVDIPYNLREGHVEIEMISPYKDYGAKISTIFIGNRDVLILQLLQKNIFNIICNVAIIICGIIFFILFMIQRLSHQSTEGMQYLSAYCIVAAIYYFIETKTMNIFYGNQTLYSVLVFLCLMLIPFFIALYYSSGVLREYQKRWKLLLGLTSLNIAIQLPLQLFNLVDLLEMSVFSHALIALTFIMVAKCYWDTLKTNPDRSIKVGMLAILFMGLGGTADIARMYMATIGDMGKFSRLGTACFSIIMLYQHMSQMTTGYTRKIEENARLLQREMESVELKNQQLETANKLAEEARQEAMDADAAKGRFLAHMSHEIRTPINAILGMDTMILRESTDLQIKEYALDIQNAGQSLLALINDILDFSKIESGKLEIITAEYDLSSLIHDISNMIKEKAKDKRLELKIRVDEQLPSKLLGDDVRIRQVLVNLLNNAVKYTQKGSITLSIKGQVEGRRVILDFSVEDTGIGIKEEDIGKLFQEFERLEEKRNRNIEGTGLGISITAQLLQLMRSKLGVESTYGKGSRFFFSLEQQIVDSTPVGSLEKRLVQQPTDYSYMSAFTAPEAKILVVDDNYTNLKVLVNLLKYTRVNVDVADGGKTCLDMVRKNQYDLIFLDHMMPEMDGIETLHRLKALEDNQSSQAPVVALTANAITGAKEMYLAEGFDAFLSKPVNPDKLEQMILRLLPRELLHFDTREDEIRESEETKEKQEHFTSSVSGDEELPIIDGIDWAYGFIHLPDKDLLLSTVKDFYKTIEAEAELLEQFYQESKENEKMLEQYRIKVHSMKSSANLIGALTLGGMAKILENAAREGKLERIDALHGIFMEEWRSYRERLALLVGADKKDRAAGRTEDMVDNPEQIQGYLQQLKEALEEMDIDLMDQLMEKLEEFSYPEQIQSDIERLSVLITNLDVEQAEKIIESLQNQE